MRDTSSQEFLIIVSSSSEKSWLIHYMYINTVKDDIILDNNASNQTMCKNNIGNETNTPYMVIH